MPSQRSTATCDAEAMISSVNTTLSGGMAQNSKGSHLGWVGRISDCDDSLPVMGSKGPAQLS